MAVAEAVAEAEAVVLAAAAICIGTIKAAACSLQTTREQQALHQALS